MTQATDVRRGGSNDVGMVMPTRAEIEDWIAMRGPARAELLAPAQPILSWQLPDPPEIEEALAPLLWLLRAARDEPVPLEEGGPTRGFCKRFGRQFGFRPAKLPDGGRLVLEAWASFLVAERADALDLSDSEASITSRGRELVEDPAALWKETCFYLAADAGPVARAAELIFAANLIEVLAVRPLTREEAERHAGMLWRALKEAFGVDRVPNNERAEAADHMWSACTVFDALCRALHFTSTHGDITRFTRVGLSTAVEVLRFAALSHRARYAALGRWN